MLKKQYKYVVLGGGVSGLATAHILSERFPGEVCIIEKEGQLGGLARNINNNGDILDLGSHRLQENYDSEVLKFIVDVSKTTYINRVERKSKLYLQSCFIDYPIDFLRLFFTLNIFKVVFSLIQSLYYKISYIGRNENFEQIALKRVGGYLYRTFYRPYVRKIWGDPKDVSGSLMKKRFSLNPWNILKQTINKKKKVFLYLKGGFQGFISSLQKELEEKKTDIYLGVQDFSLSYDDKTLVFEEKEIHFEKLISTIPLDLLLQKIHYNGPVLIPEYVGIHLIYIYLNIEIGIEGETFYFPEEEFIFGRISIPKRFDDGLQDGSDYTVYCFEIPESIFFKKKYGSMSKEELHDMLYANCMEGIKDTFGIDIEVKQDERNFIKYIPYLYPKYLVGWKENLSKLSDYLGKAYPHLYLSGRPGLFLHCNIDHSMKLGFLLGRHILSGGAPDDWYDKAVSFQKVKVRD